MSMTCRETIRRPVLAGLLAVLLVLGAVPAVSGQDSQDVVVTATVDSYLAITLCELSADFGTGLTPLGDAPTSSDTIFRTAEGLNTGEGVFYIWQPTCPGDLFLTIESNLGYDVFSCSTASSGTSPDLSVAQGDLRFTINVNFGSYASANANLSPFADCAAEPVPSFSRDEHYRAAVWYYLRVDDGDEPGTFQSTTTWSVVAN